MKKKVLVITANNLGIGGIQSVIIEIKRRLSNEFNFDYVVFDHLDTFFEEECMTEGSVFAIPYETDGIRKKIDFFVRGNRLYWGIKRIIREFGPYDAVHCHNYFEAGIVLKAAKDANIPVRIAHSHSCMPIARKKIIRRFFNHQYRNLILKNATNCLACSSLAGDYLFGEGSKYTVIANPVNTERFAYAAEQASPCSPWSFIQVGRYGYPKNPEFSLRVFAEIVNVHPEATFTLVGEGNNAETESVNKTIDTLGIRDNVMLEPAQSDIPELLKQCNILLFPSAYEGLGTVLIEAQSVGLKCFSSSSVPRETNLGHIEYIDLEDGPVIWAERIIDYVNANGFRRYKENMGIYDVKNIGQFYMKLYEGEMREDLT